MPLFAPTVPVVGLRSGGFYTVPTGAKTTLLIVQARMYLIPFTLEKPATLDRIGGSITVIGTANAVVRLGIYGDNNNLPGALILDAGTIDGTSATDQAITISQVLAAGRYWLAIVGQGAPVTQPTLNATTSTFNDSTIGMFAQTQEWANGFSQNAVAAGLPDPAVATGTPNGFPFVYVRAV